jgi:hypothetical protein
MTGVDHTKLLASASLCAFYGNHIPGMIEWLRSAKRAKDYEWNVTHADLGFDSH